VATLFKALANDSGPPLFYLLEKPFVSAGEKLFSTDVLARLLPFAATLVLFAGALALSTAAAKRRFLLLSAASPLLLLYAAEARAYALLALFGFSLFVLALVLPERPRLFAPILLLSAAILYTHYLGIFVVGALVIVAAAEKRRRSLLALLAGAASFAFWIPVMARQPRQAVAWMHQAPSELVTGILSSLGGAGDIPPPFGPALPTALVAAGVALAVAIAIVLARQWRADSDLRRGCAFLVLFFGGVLFVSLARPVAFAGRTEMAILPVWLWVVARAAEESRAVRMASLLVLTVAAASSAILLVAPREPPAATRALDSIEQVERPGDVLFAGAHFYLPARLAADRGRLEIAVRAFPLEQAEHPGWTVPRRPGPEDLTAVDHALDHAGASGRVFFLVPPSYRIALAPVLARRGVMRRITETPEMLLAVWTRSLSE
jgi:hypothetical protein